MKKRLTLVILLMIFSITIVLVTGCSDGQEAGSEDKVESKEEEKKDDKGTRSNPIEIGEAVEWKVNFYSDADDWEGLEGLVKLTLNKIYQGEEAMSMLYFPEDALENVEEGYVFAVGEIRVELVEGDEDYPYTTSFDIGSVSEDGRKTPSAYESLAEEYEENEYTDLYPGGSVDIKQAFLVPEEGEYLIEIEENISGSKFFKHK